MKDIDKPIKLFPDAVASTLTMLREFGVSVEKIGSGADVKLIFWKYDAHGTMLQSSFWHDIASPAIKEKI